MTAIAACRTCGTEPLRTPGFVTAVAHQSERDTHAEYKQVTVLFADVVHSMDIARPSGRSGCGRSWRSWWIGPLLW